MRRELRVDVRLSRTLRPQLQQVVVALSIRNQPDQRQQFRPPAEHLRIEPDALHQGVHPFFSGEFPTSGKELLDGIRLYALKSFGPMVPTMLEAWGIHSCEDFGEIVFNMIKYQVANKSESDSRDDFKGGYNFDDAFRKPFLPSKVLAAKEKKDAAKMSVGD